MAISVQCPGCRKPLKARDELAGKRVKCPACGNSVTVAAAGPRRDVPQAVPTVPRPAEPQPPALAPRHHPGLEGLSPDYRIRLGQWIAVARPHYRAVLGPILGYFFVFLPIVAGYFLIGWSALAALSGVASYGLALAVLPVVWLTFLLFVFPILTLGFHVVCQAQLKGAPWTFGTFFSGFRWRWPLAGRAVLLLLVELATALPALVIPALSRLIWREPPLLVVGLTGALVLGCSLAGGYVLLRLLFFSHLLIVDRGCGAVEALRGSWLLSRGHIWGLLGTLLLVLGAVGLIPLLVLGLHLLVAMPTALLLPLLALATIAQLFALPAGVLFLNAGYLLVAGAEPLPGQPPAAERPEPLVPSLWTWAPTGAVAAAVLLFGLGMTLRADAERTRMAKMDNRRREEAGRYAERDRLAQARARQEAEEQAKDLVAFFREGGCWSMELFGWDEPPAELATGEAGPPRPSGRMGGATVSRRQRIVVLGPRGLLKAKRAVRLGVAVEPGPAWAAAIQRLNELSFVRSGLLAQRFFPQFADALARGEVEAVLVEAVLESGPSAGTAAGASGGGSNAAVPGVPPRGAAGGPGDAGGAANGITGSHGAAVSLDKAAPLTRERFLELFDNQSQPAPRR